MSTSQSNPEAPVAGGKAIERVLLTGATGFIGRNLHPVLRRHGYRVVSASRDPNAGGKTFPDQEFKRLDVTDADSVEAAMQGCP